MLAAAAAGAELTQQRRRDIGVGAIAEGEWEMRAEEMRADPLSVAAAGCTQYPPPSPPSPRPPALSTRILAARNNPQSTIHNP
jgi:hypothetical protein